MLSVAILAGGISPLARLPSREKIPKSLIGLTASRFSHTSCACSRGIQHVVLCAGHLGEAIRDFAGDGSRFGVKLEYSFDGPVLRGTGGAIHQALPLLGESFLVVYGEFLICPAITAVEASGKLGLMAGLSESRPVGLEQRGVHRRRLHAATTSATAPRACSTSIMDWARFAAKCSTPSRRAPSATSRICIRI